MNIHKKWKKSPFNDTNSLSYFGIFFLFFFFPYPPQWILCSTLHFINQSVLPKRTIVKSQKVRGEPGKSSVEVIQGTKMSSILKHKTWQHKIPRRQHSQNDLWYKLHFYFFKSSKSIKIKKWDIILTYKLLPSK